ncbi:MAG: 23S rRNA (pseudouridine(1915)-N(3))-methyltransferase RlmH [Firmicutes bacterium]|nr:23S rRNA (pseudouridine(1915)-N(3))-methyltransferase RlmH [Bacillota bacterium]
MLTIKIIAVGTIKEKFFTDAISEYVKRLGKYCKLEIIQVKESDIKRECEEIKTKLRGHVFLCDINGQSVSSVGLSKRVENISQTSSTISFVIGGSDGVGNYLDDVVSEKISFGGITLPHQLFRVILVEQIYRAFTIAKGEKYHK